MNHPQDLSPPSPHGSGGAYSYGPLATQRTPLGFAARLLKHDAARARVQAATKALRDDPSPTARSYAREALAAYAKAEHRLARSRMRMQECLEAEGHREPWFGEGS